MTGDLLNKSAHKLYRTLVVLLALVRGTGMFVAMSIFQAWLPALRSRLVDDIEPGRVAIGTCHMAWSLFVAKGGHILVSRSKSNSLIQHIGYVIGVKDGGIEVLEFVPLRRQFGWRALFAAFLFRGKWQRRVIK